MKIWIIYIYISIYPSIHFFKNAAHTLAAPVAWAPVPASEVGRRNTLADLA